MNFDHYLLSGGYTYGNYKLRSIISELNVKTSLRCVCFSSFTEKDYFLNEFNILLLFLFFEYMSLSSWLSINYEILVKSGIY